MVKKLTYNSQEGWFITNLIQSSYYSIIDGLYKSDRLDLKDIIISLPLPTIWEKESSDQGILQIKGEQSRIIGAFEELGGYYLPNHRNILSDKKLDGGMGESHLLLLFYQSPAAGEKQESWQEVHAMLPLKGGKWLDCWVKVNPGNDAAQLQKTFENIILEAASY